jgi:hypothetical protein
MHRAMGLHKEQAMSSSRIDEVTRILEALAAIPGGRELAVLARRFSRCDPSGAWTSYGEWHWSMELTGPPPAGPPIPEDADDIVLTLRGAPPARQAPSEISGRLSMLMSRDLDDHWEFRADFNDAGDRRDDATGYRLTVFQNFAGGMGRD